VFSDVSSVLTTKKAIFILTTTTTRGGGIETTSNSGAVHAVDPTLVTVKYFQKAVIIGQYIKVG
jgi:hypothetical protein